MGVGRGEGGGGNVLNSSLQQYCVTYIRIILW